jgi:hypothetical protein
MGKVFKSVAKFAVGRGISAALGGGIPGLIGSTAFGLATSGGGSKKSNVVNGRIQNYVPPPSLSPTTYNDGRGNSFDLSKYTIRGDKGDYNLLPYMSRISADGKIGGDSRKLANTMLSQMNGDQTAIQKFNELYGVKSGNGIVKGYQFVDPSLTNADLATLKAASGLANNEGMYSFIGKDGAVQSPQAIASALSGYQRPMGAYQKPGNK